MESRGGSHRRRGVPALALLLMLLGIASILPATAAAATTSISGTITAAPSHVPIPGAFACAYWLGEGTPAEGKAMGCEITQEDGTYSIAGLALGEFKVEFSADSYGFIRQYWENETSWADADPLPVGAGGAPGTDAELTMGGRIEGRVTAAADGSPVEGVQVCAISAATEFVSNCGISDELGYYAIKGLETGQYKVEFWPGSAPGGLIAEYYDDKATLAEAGAVSVEAGQITEGIDAALAAEPHLIIDPGGPPAESSPPPPLPISNPPPVQRPRHKCRKGFRKRRVQGHVRCVKIHRRHRHHR